MLDTICSLLRYSRAEIRNYKYLISLKGGVGVGGIDLFDSMNKDSLSVLNSLSSSAVGIYAK